MESSIAAELHQVSLSTLRKEKGKEKKSKHLDIVHGMSGKLSGKKKRAVLQARRDQKRLDDHENAATISEESLQEIMKEIQAPSTLKLVSTLGRSHQLADAELSTYFVKETKQQIYLRTIEGRAPLNMKHRETPLKATAMIQDPILDFPKRPSWNYKSTKSSVDNKETVMFDNWLEKIHAKYEYTALNHFEHNLQVWRQLWRVLERATSVVLVVDIRNPLLHIPPSLYDYVVNEMKKPLIVALNKVDLIPASVLEMWLVYLKKAFPECKFVQFSSRSHEVTNGTAIGERRKTLSQRLVVGDPLAMQSAKNLLVACGVDPAKASKVIDEINTVEEEDGSIKSAKSRRRRARKQKKEVEDAVDSCDFCGSGAPVLSCVECSETFELCYMCATCHKDQHLKARVEHTVVALQGNNLEDINTELLKKYPDNEDPGVVLGLVGQPNVGKSSVLNSLVGKKRVSVSHTAGHTKSLQTILLDDEVCICDCPGLVFPYTGVPRFMQELSGLYPYAQVREPLSAVRFLSEHIPLEEILDLKARTEEFDGYIEDVPWTPFSICEAYAEKRNYKTDQRGRPDQHRAGVELIRDSVDGILPLFFYPPDYKGMAIALSEKSATADDVQQARRAQVIHVEDVVEEDEEVKTTMPIANSRFAFLNDDSSDSEEEDS